jgi:DNA polymerase III delta subunit
MLISELKNNIVQGNIDNFYIFTGPEEGIMDIYIKQISKKLGLTIKWVDSLEEVSKQLNLKSLVKVRYLYLIRQDKAIKTQETMWEFLKTKIVGNYIILIEPTVDKKTKFYKFFEDKMVTFEKLSLEMLAQYAKRRCPSLSDKNIEKLCEWCSNSYLRVMNELDKIATLSKQTGLIVDSAMSVLDQEGGIYKEQHFDIFQYSDLILNRNVNACYEYINKAKQLNQDILLLGCLMQAFRGLVLLKNDGGGKGLCERTGLTPWQARCAIQVDSNFGVEECENNLLFLQDLDVKIKTGGIQPDMVLNYILAEIL